jgi:hypothetical protein
MEMKGNYIPVQETTAISEHLKIIVVKCDVVDEKVYKVLKLLSTCNIRKLTRNNIKFFNISKVFLHVHKHLGTSLRIADVFSS